MHSMQRDDEHVHASTTETVSRTCAVIFNPIKVDDAFTDLMRSALDNAGFTDVQWLETIADDPGHAMTAEAVAAHVDLVVVAGGDGTVRVVASGLAGTGIPLGIIPAGTANLLARNLDLPLNLEAALEVAIGDHSATIDLVEMTVDDGAPERFAVAAGTGLDAMIMDEVDPRLKAKVGSAAYFVAAGKALGQVPFPVEISIDGGPTIRRQSALCLIANVGELQGGLRLIPSARVDDGFLHVYVASPRHIGDWAKAVMRLIRQRSRSDDPVDLWRGRKVDIRLGSENPYQMDGDVIGAGTHLHAVVLPGALTVRVSAAASSA